MLLGFSKWAMMGQCLIVSLLNFDYNIPECTFSYFAFQVRLKHDDIMGMSFQQY